MLNREGSPDDGPLIRLHKIHGSLVWYQRSGYRYVKIPLLPLQQSVHYFDHEPVEPVMLYPALMKEGSLGPYPELLHRFRSALRATHVLICAGYSFRDDHIRGTVLEALAHSRHLTLILVDPHASAIRDLYVANRGRWIARLTHEHLHRAHYRSPRGGEKDPAKIRPRTLRTMGEELLRGSGHSDASDRQREAAFVALVKAVTARARTWRNTPHARKLQVLSLDLSGYPARGMLTDRTDLSSEVSLRFAEIAELPEAQRCVDLHRDANWILPEKTVSGVPVSSLRADELGRFRLQQLLEPVGQAVTETFPETPAHRDIVGLYRHTMTGWKDPYVVWDVIAPIANFGTNLVRVQRFEDLEIRPLTAEDKSALWRRFGFPFSLGVFDFDLIWAAGFQICGQYRFRRDENVDSQFGRDVIIDFLSALRLHKAGPVGVTNHLTLLHQPASWDFDNCQGSYRDETLTVHISGNPYFLPVKEMPRVRRLYGELRTQRRLPRGGGLSLALRSFNQSYGRQNVEDRILDLTVALEAAVLTKLRSEQHLWLPLRLELLLPKRHREAMIPLANLLYAVRSYIVHQGHRLDDAFRESEVKKLRKKVTPPLTFEDGGWDFAMRSEELVRTVQREYLRRLPEGESTRKINEQIDLKIPAGRRPDAAQTDPPTTEQSA